MSERKSKDESKTTAEENCIDQPFSPPPDASNHIYSALPQDVTKLVHTALATVALVSQVCREKQPDSFALQRELSTQACVRLEEHVPILTYLSLLARPFEMVKLGKEAKKREGKLVDQEG